MKKRLTLAVSMLAIAGLIFGASWGPIASATTPGPNQLASSDPSGNAASGESDLTQHSVSGDGRYVVFASRASNLAVGDIDANWDVFVKDIHTGAVTLASITETNIKADWANSPAISYDGRYVVFRGAGPGVAEARIYRRDLISSTTVMVSVDGGTAHAGENPDINADGRYVTYVRDTPGAFSKNISSSRTYRAAHYAR